MINLYETLGVSPDASKSDIKKAYRSKAQKNHPDKGGDEEVFHQIQLAYDVLGDTEKRDRCDRTGETETVKDPYTPAEMKLVELFNQIISNGSFNRDIVKVATETISGKIHQLNLTVHQGEMELSNLKSEVGRVTCEDEENIFNNLLNGKIGEIDSQILNLKQEISTLEDSLVLLEHYEDQRAPEEVVPSQFKWKSL